MEVREPRQEVRRREYGDGGSSAASEVQSVRNQETSWLKDGHEVFQPPATSRLPASRGEPCISRQSSVSSNWAQAMTGQRCPGAGRGSHLKINKPDIAVFAAFEARVSYFQNNPCRLAINGFHRH